MEKSTKIIFKWKILLNYEETKSIFLVRKRKECYIPQTNIRLQDTDAQSEEKLNHLDVAIHSYEYCTLLLKTEDTVKV